MSPRARKSDLTLEQSKRLTAEIHNCLIVTAQKIEKFISGRGWMPMGYDNFSEWYKAEGLSDLTLGREIRAHIIYAMIADKHDDVTIALAIKEVGPESVANVRRQKGNGIAPERASLRHTVSYISKRKSAPYIITIEFTEEKRADFLRIAGSSSEMIRLAREFIEQGFEELS